MPPIAFRIRFAWLARWAFVFCPNERTANVHRPAVIGLRTEDETFCASGPQPFMRRQGAALKRVLQFIQPFVIFREGAAGFAVGGFERALGS